MVIGNNIIVGIGDDSLDVPGYLEARDPETGEILWHTRLHASVANGPMTYELDGQQYLVVGGGDSLYAFTVLE